MTDPHTWRNQIYNKNSSIVSGFPPARLLAYMQHLSISTTSWPLRIVEKLVLTPLPLCPGLVRRLITRFTWKGWTEVAD